MKHAAVVLVTLSGVACTCLPNAEPDGGQADGAGLFVDGGARSDGGAGLDAGTDAGLDAGPDAGLDAGPDAGLDAGPDAGLDAGPDAGLDAGPDAGTDAGTDAGLDAGADAGLDAGPDAGLVLDGGFTDAGLWTWVWTPQRGDSAPIWGALGQADAGSDPGRRADMAAWASADGGLLVFGGSLMSGSGSLGVDNSLWHFDGRAWVRLSGSSGVDGRATFGVLGVRSCTNLPGARALATAWPGPDGGLYLYGGEGFVGFGVRGQLSDVWRYDGCWTWVAGTQQTGSTHTYVTRGVPGGSPGARTQALAWSNGSTAWVYGGFGPVNAFADLWRFDGNTWTWLHGQSPAPSTVNVDYGQLGVASPSNTPGSRVGSATWVDASGTLWLYGGQGPGVTGQQTVFADLWKFDGAAWVWLGGSPGAGASASHGLQGLALSTNSPGPRVVPFVWTDGAEVWLFGGIQGINNLGADLWKFDGTFWTWVSGSDQPNQFSLRGTLGVTAPANRPGSRSSGAAVRTADGALLFGGSGLDAPGRTTLGDAWRYRK